LATKTEDGASDQPADRVAIHGVQLRRLAMNRDARGCFTELYSNAWGLPIEPVQWSLVASSRKVLRGMHLHLRHDEYIVVVQGRACIGLYDLRPDSPTRGASSLIELDGNSLTGVCFPRGVLHGWYFYEDGVHLQAVSERYAAYHPEDNLGCLWSDAELNIPWPDRTPIVSERSASFPSLRELAESVWKKDRALDRKS
jgi:dTDP-4-dehydrorhamnose 3,5-epimerase